MIIIVTFARNLPIYLNLIQRDVGLRREMLNISLAASLISIFSLFIIIFVELLAIYMHTYSNMEITNI